MPFCASSPDQRRKVPVKPKALDDGLSVETRPSSAVGAAPEPGEGVDSPTSPIGMRKQARTYPRTSPARTATASCTASCATPHPAPVAPAQVATHSIQAKPPIRRAPARTWAGRQRAVPAHGGASGEYAAGTGTRVFFQQTRARARPASALSAARPRPQPTSACNITYTAAHSRRSPRLLQSPALARRRASAPCPHPLSHTFLRRRP